MRSMCVVSKLICSAALLLVMLLLAGCNGGALQQTPAGTGAATRTIPVQAPAATEVSAPFDMPLPDAAQFSTERRAAYTAADLRIEGEDFAAGLPRQRAAATAGGCQFTPDWEAGDEPVGLSCATYAFDIEGYDLNSELRFTWSDAPADGQLWIALSDWGQNRWKWFKPSAGSGSLKPADIQQFISFFGNMLVVVLLTGNSSAELDWLRVGSDFPVASLVCSGATSSFAPLNTSFDASASFDPDGSIVKYEWDWNTDGSFDNTSGANPLAEHSFSDPGRIDVTVRVTDDSGLRDTASVTVHVIDDWHHSFGGPGDEVINSVAVAPDGTVWACGASSNLTVQAAAHDLLLLQFSPSGEVLQEIRWAADEASSSFHRAEDIVIDSSDGRIYLLGQLTHATISGSLFQCWSPAGELEHNSLLDFDIGKFEALIQVGDGFYACGYSEPDDGLRYGTWLAIAKDGAAGICGRVESNSRFHDLTFEFPVDILDPPLLHLCGIKYEPENDNPFARQDALYCAADLNSNNITSMSWGEADTAESAIWVRRSGNGLNRKTLIGLRFHDSELNSTFSGVSQLGQATFSSYSMPAGFYSTSFSGGNSSFISGYTNSLQAVLLQLDSSYNLQQAYLGSGSVWPECSVQYSGGSLLIGGLAQNAEGQFSEAGALPVNPQFSNWANLSLSRTDFAGSNLVLTLDNTATERPESVLDSGGGGNDAWVGLLQLPLE